MHHIALSGEAQVNEKLSCYKTKNLIEFCTVARSRDEMQMHLGITNRGHFRTAYLKPLLDSGKLKMTLPDKPSSHHQKYIKA